MHDGMPYGRNQGQGHSREVDRQSPTGLIFCLMSCLLLWQEIRESERRREYELRNANASNSGTLSTSTNAAAGLIGVQLNGRDNNNGVFGGAITNLIVIIGFAAFAFAVKQILASMM